jgi:hypothetical protein
MSNRIALVGLDYALRNLPSIIKDLPPEILADAPHTTKYITIEEPIYTDYSGRAKKVKKAKRKKPVRSVDDPDYKRQRNRAKAERKRNK